MHVIQAQNNWSLLLRDGCYVLALRLSTTKNDFSFCLAFFFSGKVSNRRRVSVLLVMSSCMSEF